MGALPPAPPYPHWIRSRFITPTLAHNRSKKKYENNFDESVYHMWPKE